MELLEALKALLSGFQAKDFRRETKGIFCEIGLKMLSIPVTSTRILKMLEKHNEIFSIESIFSFANKKTGLSSHLTGLAQDQRISDTRPQSNATSEWKLFSWLTLKQVFK